MDDLASLHVAAAVREHVATELIFAFTDKLLWNVALRVMNGDQPQKTFHENELKG